jgi:hypothetical protein
MGVTIPAPKTAGNLLTSCATVSLEGLCSMESVTAAYSRFKQRGNELKTIFGVRGRGCEENRIQLAKLRVQQRVLSMLLIFENETQGKTK